MLCHAGRLLQVLFVLYLRFCFRYSPSVYKGTDALLVVHGRERSRSPVTHRASATYKRLLPLKVSDMTMILFRVAPIIYRFIKYRLIGTFSRVSVSVKIKLFINRYTWLLYCACACTCASPTTCSTVLRRVLLHE